MTVIEGLTECCGPARLGLIHANDCMFERGSKRDRHAWIGDGLIGPTGFEAMVCLPQLEGVCACTEMPGEVPVKDEVNISRLKAHAGLVRAVTVRRNGLAQIGCPRARTVLG